MDVERFIGVMISGVSQGMLLFIVAAGLTLVFGVMHLLNFAHGGMYMLGAYLLTVLLGGGQPGLLVFLLAVIGAALGVAVLGAVTERVMLRPMLRFGHDELRVLLATFGLLIVLEGAAQLIFGSDPRSQSLPGSIAGSFAMGGVRIPTYDVVLLAAGLLLVGGLAWLLNASRFGIKLKAVADDQAMSEAIGVRAGRVRLIAFALGSGLAGLGGALYAPLVGITSSIGTAVIIQVFAVVIVAGLGAIWGALWVAITLGLLNSALSAYVPSVSPYVFFVALLLALTLRPDGLFARKGQVSV